MFKVSLNIICALALLLFSTSPGFSAGEEVALKARRGDALLVEVGAKKISGDAWFTLGGKEFTLRKAGDFYKGLAAVDRDAKPGACKVEIFTGSREKPLKLAVRTVTVGDRKFPEQRLKVDQKTVTLSKEDLERAARERELISKALGLRSPDLPWLSGWQRPVEGVETSPFGLERYYNGQKGSYHGGIDIASPAGTPVKASSGGRVALTGDFFYTGNTVFVDHGDGVMTGYFHMSEISVKEGDNIEEGRAVGRVGSTGRSTGAHLHWSLYIYGVKADPNSLFTLLNTP